MVQTLLVSWPYLAIVTALVASSLWAWAHAQQSGSYAGAPSTVTRGPIHRYGTRILVGLILLSAFWMEDPLALYVVLAFTMIWILAPTIAGRGILSGGLVLVLASILVAAGYIRYVFPAATKIWMATGGPSLLPIVQFGTIRLALGEGAVTHQAIWLNGLCLVGAIIGIGLSFVRSFSNEDFNGPFTVLYMGVVCGAVLMYAVSKLQQLPGLASLYLLIAAISFGWLLLSFVMRTMVRSGQYASKHTKANYLPIYHGIPDSPYPPPRPAPPPIGGPLDRFGYVLEAIIVHATNMMVKIIVGMINILIGLVNFILETLRNLANLLIRILVWIALYLQAVIVGVIKDALHDLPQIYQLATSGFRVSLFAPALMALGGVLLILCSDAGISYLLQGHLAFIFIAWDAFAVSALIAVLASASFIAWDVMRSFGNLIQYYVGDAFFFFTLYLDIYGLERLVVHAPSHFGIVSWVLTGLIMGFAVLFLVTNRGQSQSAGNPAGSHPLRHVALVVVGVIGVLMVGPYGLVAGLPSVLAQEAQGAPISSLGLGRAPGVYVPPVVIPPPPPITTVYAGTSTHGLYALQADSGSVIWRQTGIDGGTGGKSAIAGGIVYVGGWGGDVYAFNTSNGSLRWKAATGGHVLSSPTVANGTVYIGSNDGYLYALRAGDGARVWRFQTQGYVWSTPQIVNGIVYFGSLDGHVYAVRAHDGSLVWRFQAGDWILSSPTVAGGSVYVGSRDHYLYALRATDGKLLWRFRTGGVINSQPAVANGIVYVGSHDRLVYALHATDGSLLWSYATTGLIDSSPVVSQDLLYFGADDHYLYALHVNIGSLAWRHATGGQVTCTPLVANGTLYVNSWDGTMYALNASQGSLIWRFQGGFDQASPVGA